MSGSVHITLFCVRTKEWAQANAEMSTVHLESRLLKLRTVLHADNAQRAMTPSERAQYIAKICATASRLAKLKLEAWPPPTHPTKGTTQTQPKVKISRPVGKASILYLHRVNEKGRLTGAVFARCASGSGDQSFAWGQQACSIKRALAQLSSTCACGARFHLIR